MATGRTRIHITPFSSALLDRFIPPSLQPAATGISFHTLQTFPERGFGYVELPTMEAEKMKRKFNGTTLKGAKVKIEDAKPEKTKRKSDVEAEDGGEGKKRASREGRKREEGVLVGHELEEGRKVKRGWSEEKKGRKAKGGADDGRKLRFKTVVPGTAVPVEREKKVQKKKEEVKKKNKGKKTTVVEEFAKHKVPAVVRNTRSSTKATTEFVEGKGWVDEDGEVVEAAPKSSRPKRKEEKAAVEPVAQVIPEPAAANEEKEDSSSEVLSSSSDPVSSSDSDDESHAGESTEPAAKQDLAPPPASRSTPEPLRDTPLAGPKLPADSKQVHPLEALFKRPAAHEPSASTTSTPRPKPTPIDTSFAFFNSGAPDPDDGDQGSAVRNSREMHIDLPPQTPHTRQDMEWRAIRSAAPTPDTAAIGKRFSFEIGDGEDEDEDEEMDAAGGPEEGTGSRRAKGDPGEREEESAFRKWFYENRGDLNRGWKKRRREERKVRRQRENRRMGRKVA